MDITALVESYGERVVLAMGGLVIGAWVGKDFKLEGFSDGYGMRRSIFGAIFVGLMDRLIDSSETPAAADGR